MFENFFHQRIWRRSSEGKYVKSVNICCRKIDWKYFRGIGCVHNYCFSNFVMFAKSECEENEISKVNEMGGGYKFYVIFEDLISHA